MFWKLLLAVDYMLASEKGIRAPQEDTHNHSFSLVPKL